MENTRTRPVWLRPKYAWAAFWMRFAGTGRAGRVATRLAEWAAPPYKGKRYLANLHPQGYVSSHAEIHKAALRRGAHVFVGDRVAVYAADAEAGPVTLGDGAHIHRDTIIELGAGGSVEIGAHTHIQPGCLLAAYKGPIIIGENVQIGAGCRFYSYDHGFVAGTPIMAQPLHTRGGIRLEEGVWLGAGVTVLDGVTVGTGAVVGAGAVVTSNIAENAIAVGVPARVVAQR